jgi:hypothetical protein
MKRMVQKSKNELSSLDLIEMLRILAKNRHFRKVLPVFYSEEIELITEFIFFKPPNIFFKVYERIPRKKETPIKRTLFINNFFGEAKFNGAKAARMSGYSHKSAKQIAYKLKRS